jgi:type IV pilus biogenesis protein CpaD/CtpE
VDALQRLVPLLVLVIALSSLIAAIALWRDANQTGALADETAKRACIEAANAKYPPVGVSAFVTRDRRDTGPIKLSYVRERARAVDAC